MSSPGQRQLSSDDGALLSDSSAEAIGFGGATASVRNGLAGFLDKLLLLDQSAEIRLVNVKPSNRLDAPLQLQQRENRRHKLEHDRVVFDLGAEPRNSGRKNSAMVGDHWPPKRLVSMLACPTARFRDQPGFEEKLVALQHEFLIPTPTVEPEGDCGAHLAGGPVAIAVRPTTQSRRDRFPNQRRRA